MKNLVLFIAFSICILPGAIAQKYFTKSGNVTFYSDAPLEKIEAHNRSATCVIDFENGNLEMAVLIKAFQFEKALMQEHFNENYMESGKFPKSSFKGKIDNYKGIDLSKDGKHDLTVSGELTMHGVTKNIKAPATILVKGGKVTAASEFTVLVADYDIKIPAVVRDNIAKEVKITIDAPLEPLNRG